MQYPPSPAGRPDPTQGQTHHMAQSANTYVLLMMFRVPSKGTYCDLSKKKGQYNLSARKEFSTFSAEE